MLNVLLVDDQAPFREVARTVVELVPDWRLIGEVETGEDAVRTASAEPTDVVLMDINLPGISGLEATRQIVSARPDVRVVLLSTYRAEDLPADAMSCGAIAYLRKEDLTPRALRSAIGG